jgi:hypothetical protein
MDLLPLLPMLLFLEDVLWSLMSFGMDNVEMDNTEWKSNMEEGAHPKKYKKEGI